MYQGLVQSHNQASCTLLALGEELGYFVVPSDDEVSYWKDRRDTDGRNWLGESPVCSTATVCGTLEYVNEPDYPASSNTYYVYFTVPVILVDNTVTPVESDVWAQVKPTLIHEAETLNTVRGIVESYISAKSIVQVGIDVPSSDNGPSSHYTAIYSGTSHNSSSVQVAIEGIRHDVYLVKDKVNQHQAQINKLTKLVAALYKQTNSKIDVDTL